MCNALNVVNNICIIYLAFRLYINLSLKKLNDSYGFVVQGHIDRNR